MWVSGTELADVVGESEPETDESAREPAAAAAAAAESARQPAATKPETQMALADFIRGSSVCALQVLEDPFLLRTPRGKEAVEWWLQLFRGWPLGGAASSEQQQQQQQQQQPPQQQQPQPQPQAAPQEPKKKKKQKRRKSEAKVAAPIDVEVFQELWCMKMGPVLAAILQDYESMYAGAPSLIPSLIFLEACGFDSQRRLSACLVLVVGRNNWLHRRGGQKFLHLQAPGLEVYESAFALAGIGLQAAARWRRSSCFSAAPLRAADA
eukprot:SAG31_NODE_1055_length_10134_cov_14.461837_11_plen_266_part_00